MRIDTQAGSWIFLSGQIGVPLFSRIRGKFFPKDQPTGTAVRIAGLLLNARIEIDAVAILPAGHAA